MPARQAPVPGATADVLQGSDFEPPGDSISWLRTWSPNQHRDSRNPDVGHWVFHIKHAHGYLYLQSPWRVRMMMSIH